MFDEIIRNVGLSVNLLSFKNWLVILERERLVIKQDKVTVKQCTIVIN